MAEDNKAKAVRDYIRKHRNAKPKDVAEALASKDIEVTAKYVSNVKLKMKSKKTKAKAKPRKKKAAAAKSKAKSKARPKSSSKAPWQFPKNTLEDAIRIASALEEKFAGNPAKAADIVKAVGFNKVNDWRYHDLLKSATLYGITSGTGQTSVVKLEKLGEDIIAPSSSTQRQRALLTAFRNVEDFKNVESYYGGKKIPEDEFFENTLVRTFEIPRDRVKTFMKVYLDNLVFLKAFSASADEQKPEALNVKIRDFKPESEVAEKRVEGVRKFLDTCFVMMPFGKWFDRYYEEIYVPAIKEAGFEPVRADQLFSTGSVVEQIWEQIEKSKVLLADLTGKNPNVFYELGLAHAARKPVVFTSGELEDIPFDLRHLRVITYEVKEPEWNTKLKASITAYLKNAKAEPEKALPQPFRDIELEPQNGG